MDLALGENLTPEVGNISNVPEQKDRLFENIKLSDLANKFEAILQRVKELELCHLIDPIQAAAQKLRQLDVVTEKLACDYYDDHACANKDCCNELNISEGSDKTFFDARSYWPKNSRDALDSCLCFNPAGIKSCYCDQSGQKSLKNLTTPSLHKTETYCVEKKSKCDPCRCGIDETGKRTKTLDCKLAARARKQERKELQSRHNTNGADNHSTRPHTADAKLTSDAPRKSLNGGNVVVERRVSNSKIEVQTNLNEMTLNVNKENRVVTDTVTYVGVKDRSQGVLCKLSSESSSEEYDSGSSSDDVYSSISLASKDFCYNPFGFVERKNNSRSESDLGSCGCGQQPTAASCPCGCGDAMDPPHTRDKCLRRSRCRCENCGKEIPKPTPATMEIAAEKANPVSGGRKNCVIPYTDVKMYIQELEHECREKDKIIKELTEQIDEKTSSDDSRGNERNAGKNTSRRPFTTEEVGGRISNLTQ